MREHQRTWLNYSCQSSVGGTNQFPRFLVTRPQVFVSPASLSVREGDSAQFRCSASGFPAPVLQWHGGPGGRLPPEAQSSNGNGLLTFAAVKKKHEGEYFCTASNLGGISSTGTFLNVSGMTITSFLTKKKTIVQCSTESCKTLFYRGFHFLKKIHDKI